MDSHPITESPDSLEEAISLLLTQVPAPVQAFVLNDLGQTTNLLMAVHNLHIDQAGVLQRELLLMLLGQEDPANFATELKASGVSEATTQAILRDVNERVFKRLRTQERAEGIAPAVPEVPKERSWVEVTPQPTAAPLTPVTTYTPPQDSSPSSAASLRTMADDMRRAGAGSTGTQAPKLPGAPISVPPPVPHEALPPIQPSAPPMPVARPAPPPTRPQPQSYSADPYREQVG